MLTIDFVNGIVWGVSNTATLWDHDQEQYTYIFGKLDRELEIDRGG